MKRTIVIFLFAVLMTQLATASGNDVEAALKQQYENRNYSLRHSLIDHTQHFDSSGKPLGDGKEGAWTIYSRLYIRKIKLRPDKLTVEADRVGYEFNRQSNRLAPTKLKGSVKLEIALDQPLASSEEANALMGRVFAFSIDDFLVSVPPWWRSYLRSHKGILTGDGDSAAEIKQGEALPTQIPAAGPSDPPIKNANGAYLVGRGVEPPAPVSTPDPSYTNEARNADWREPTPLK